MIQQIRTRFLPLYIFLFFSRTGSEGGASHTLSFLINILTTSWCPIFLLLFFLSIDIIFSSSFFKSFPIKSNKIGSLSRVIKCLAGIQEFSFSIFLSHSLI
ncbi:hypothetical protein L873DRAFT_1353744 [Choiromyces venosus 120613-1]|uniref:Uncharacterized protein n=1 Tax=Choiromyces venosus 120613-1 TaxID=1336337 RepID=A0A3N4K2A4_9PEZI|nr:hypothetical protein L873DRAFT_1353744 [Choiromyces venosus 120613-1]